MTKVKRDLYERHGIKEYWLIHPVDKIFMLYTLDKGGLYQKATVSSGDDVISSTAVAGVEIQLEDIFGKVVENKSRPLLL